MQVPGKIDGARSRGRGGVCVFFAEGSGVSSPTPGELIVNAAVQRDGSVTVREIDGEIVVLDTRSNQVHQLNRTASFIWRMCSQGTTPQALASALAVEFEVDEATAFEDVVKTLEQLGSINLLAIDR